MATNQNIRLLFFSLIFILSYNGSHSQKTFPDIDPTWDKYYDEHPSGIQNKFEASDFIDVTRKVEFVPFSKKMDKNVKVLEIALLRLPHPALNQMKMDGDYFSRTLKHDDFYHLYNIYYKSIDKTTWDKYCPYLIPIMSLDDVIDLK